MVVGVIVEELAEAEEVKASLKMEAWGKEYEGSAELPVEGCCYVKEQGEEGHPLGPE